MIVPCSHEEAVTAALYVIANNQRLLDTKIRSKFTPEQSAYIDTVPTFDPDETFKMKVYRLSGRGFCKVCNGLTKHREKINFESYCSMECREANKEPERLASLVEDLKKVGLRIKGIPEYKGSHDEAELVCDHNHEFTAKILNVRYAAGDNIPCPVCRQELKEQQSEDTKAKNDARVLEKQNERVFYLASIDGTIGGKCKCCGVDVKNYVKNNTVFTPEFCSADCNETYLSSLEKEVPDIVDTALLMSITNKETSNYPTIIKNHHKALYESILTYRGITFSEKAYNALNPGLQSANCQKCGKGPLEFIDINKGYRRFCSTSCSSADKAHHMHTPKAIRNRQISLINKYGTDSVWDLSIEKRKQTNIEKRGVEYPFQSKTVYSKIDLIARNNNVAKSVRIKTIKTGKFDELVGNNCSYYGLELLSSKEDFIEGTPFKFKHIGCGKEFEIYANVSSLRGCPDCVSRSHQQRELEFEIKKFYDGEIIRDTRSVIKPRELDLYFPEDNFAIEYNGSYWHSHLHNFPPDDHINKTISAKNQGVKLVHIYEVDWMDTNRKNILLGRLMSLLGKGNKIYARETKVVNLDNETANEFLAGSHLQGGTLTSKVRLGLEYNDILVAVMTIGAPRFQKEYQWEILRYASWPGSNVVGGMSKLLKHFRESYSGSIISYADLGWGEGNVYKQLGFTRLKDTKPTPFYVRAGEILHWYSTLKDRLAAKLGAFYDETKSVEENLSEAGFYKLYDCGNAVYVLD